MGEADKKETTSSSSPSSSSKLTNDFENIWGTVQSAAHTGRQWIRRAAEFLPQSGFSPQKLIDDSFNEKIHGPLLKLSTDFNDNNKLISTLCRHHGELVVGGTAAIVGLPSLLLGRRMFMFNTFLSVAVATASIKFVKLKWEAEEGHNKSKST